MRVTGVSADFAQGEMEDTGNPLDLAIEGTGFFRLQTPDGVRYTRRGNFALGQGGVLVSQEGYPVLGAGGKPIKASSGPIVVTSDGIVSAGGQQVGRIDLAQFPETAALTKVGDSLFSAPGDPGPAKQPFALRQGALEASNVNAIHEMIQMIDALRQYEAYQKVLQAYGEIDTRSVQVAETR